MVLNNHAAMHVEAGGSHGWLQEIGWQQGAQLQKRAFFSSWGLRDMPSTQLDSWLAISLTNKQNIPRWNGRIKASSCKRYLQARDCTPRVTYLGWWGWTERVTQRSGVGPSETGNLGSPLHIDFTELDVTDSSHGQQDTQQYKLLKCFCM